MMILKIETQNTNHAEIFTYNPDGTRKSRERITAAEVEELSHAGRLRPMTGKEVANMDDIGLFSFLEVYSYYYIKPLTI